MASGQSIWQSWSWSFQCLMQWLLTLNFFAFMAAPLCVKDKLTGMTQDKEHKPDGLSTHSFVPHIIKQ